jgi:capsular polysaccharide biosynthesis protein
MPEIDLPSHVAGPARLVTARSYMIDRLVPDCEIVALPEKEVAGGRISFRRGPVTLPAIPPKGRLARARSRLKPPPMRHAPGGVLFDLRHHDPQNWAHFLNNHLPIVLRLCAETGVGWSEALLVTPEATPGYLHGGAALFGLELLATDGAVKGEGVVFEVTPWTAVRSARAGWVRVPAVAAAVDAATGKGPPLPLRPFLARRDTRVIANMAKVEACLAPHGYTTVYAEDLSPADQMRLFREAEAMVAVHGAALAPLLYVPPDGRLRQLVEILPVGHMTDVYRVMAEQVGVGWTGVRGRIKPEYVEASYRIGMPFKRFSLDSFEVDVVALARALDFASAASVDPRAGAARA